MNNDEPITDAELELMAQRADAASKGPWRPFVQSIDHMAGDNFISIGGLDDDEPDMYVYRDALPAGGSVVASDDDVEFIACARQDIPRLIAEVRRLRGVGHLPT